MQKGESGEQTAPARVSTSQTPQNATVTQAVLTAGRLQALTSLGGQQTAIGVLPAVSGVSLPTVSFTLPRTISAQSSISQPLHVSASSLSNPRLVSPQAINIIQRQLSSGIVGLSTVSAQGLQVLQASGTPLTFVTATSPEAAVAFEQQRKARLLQQQRQKQQAGAPSSSSSSTIHHLAVSSPANPISNPNQSISRTASMSGSQQLPTGPGLKRSQAAPGAVLIATTLSTSSTSSSATTISISAKDLKLLAVAQQPNVAVTPAVGTTRAATSLPGGPSPKKIKLEEKPAANKEIENCRQNVCYHKKQKMGEIKAKYREHLTELFYLQGGGNVTEFNTWKLTPTPPLLSFLEGSKLDSDEDEELQEKRINDEVKVLTSAGSNIPLATPVAISTTLPPSVSALSQQGSDKCVVIGGKQLSLLPAPSLSAQLASSLKPAMNSSTTTTPSLTSTSLPAATSSELQHHLAKSSDVKPSIHTLKVGTSSGQPISSKSIKSSGVSPSRSRQQSISSVYETVTGGSQDVIVERAKQEAQVLQRVNELRKDGLWSAKRLPRVQEPARQKAHWDYLLEEMTWLAADFIQERKWKKAAAKKLARMVSNHFKEQEQKELRAEKEEAIKLKKIASQMAKMVKEFWTNIEKVVQYKQTTRLEEKKKKALDLHLNFIVDQTEKYSSWLTAGLQNPDGSRTSSDAEFSADSGEEFQPVGTASDDEETIEKEETESGVNEDATKEEVEALQKESELPLEELLKTLPKEMLEEPSSHLPFNEESDSEVSLPSKDGDGDFTVEGVEEEDMEETIEEQENEEKKDYSGELNDLKEEGEMSVEELMKKYAGAYDSDFEMPEENSGAEEDSDDDDEEEESSESEKESGESSEEEEDAEEEKTEEEVKDAKEEEKQDVGLEFLVKTENTPQGEDSSTEGPGKEFNDIAAAAQSLQPKGYTLETTEVKTKVPFLLKHTLREYQHVGLDWLATMHDKRLNGILADEMGLGKTIQTIALLAHLACEKGVWGPHLIVVPTSVMLNWEMEFKKWCPAFKILTYYGSIKERKLKRQGWTKTNAFHVCITSYKLVVQDHQAFRRKKWKYFILDEAQNIKNFKSQRWQMLLNFSSQRRLLLTGTPLQNSLMELWSLMHFLMPNVFQSHSEFKEWFSNPLTGMIEGSQEYNESLVRRLHKVLRPFLLRRLKNEVEKQMPQKFEHVVMCRLSKRQRYLYDDFMSQTKTKETLATGHFMSVINILMQLRKVCNHPNLFDPRPIMSPFKMEGIVFHTASMATKVLEHDPLKDIDIYSLYPNLAEMETDLPAFVAQKVKHLKASGKLIEEVDSIPEPKPRPPVGQLKSVKGFAPAVLQTGRVSPVTAVSSGSQSRPASPLSTVKLTVSSVQSTTPSTVNSIKLLLPTTSSSSAQQTIVIPHPSGSGPPLILPLSSMSSSSSSSASAAIAQAKLISSQLQSGVLQLVQTSTGHQILTTNAAATSTSASTTSSTTTTTATALLSTSSSATTSAPSSSSSSSVSLLKLSSVLSQQKPVMRVSPFVVSSAGDAAISSTSSGSITSPSVMSTTTSPSTKISDTPSVDKPTSIKPMKRSELFLESLYQKKVQRRQHILALMSRLNQRRCDAGPVYGTDVHHCVNCLHTLDASNSPSSISFQTSSTSVVPCLDCWRNNGHINCLFAQNRQINHNHPAVFWRESDHLQQLVHTPEEWLGELEGVLSRFVFVTPQVISPAVSLKISHPDQSHVSHLHWLESRLRPEIVNKSAVLHPIQCRTMVTFPELRLIQYDCGKLQTLDLLLRQLKSGQHRVLIFTQMTKMLDVLEAFLNFHGHRYLRLDGTTKVEQRQYLMDRFNADPRIFCFILSTRSGGVGVNLTGADTVIFYDSDWNPTMDAQAQDRCHRIGQTRDVHIYRLVSEMTVEENILKKANQKRLLGDLAIEGGNFTTAFFKEQTISDLFAEPSGLESLVEDREKEKEEKEKARQERENEEKDNKEKEETKKEAAILTQFEQALCKAEDEPDAQAAKQLQAEQKAELAEFDETIPWDERETESRRDDDDVSKVELELAMLDKELTPIERYAVTVMEAQMEPETAEELKMAEEDIENSKKDWELARLKALKEEEERRAELEEDEMLYIYSKDESQVKRGRKPLKNKSNPPKAKFSKTSMSGSDLEESFSGRVMGRRASERLSPQKGTAGPGVHGSRSPDKKKVSFAKTNKVAVAKTAIDSKKKVKAAANTLQKKAQKGTVKGKGKNSDNPTNGPKAPAKAKAEVNGQAGPQRGRPKSVKAVSNTGSPEVPKEGGNKEKKGKAKTPVHLQNGHSPNLARLNSKMATQAKNALLKQQAQQAARITVTPLQSSPRPSLQPAPATPATVVSGIVGSPPRQPAKPSTPKSPADPNVPPPWSNPNLVIRTRKAAVHSPVVIAQNRTSQAQQQQQPPQTVLQQSLNRPPVLTAIQTPITIASAANVAKLQATPDRNIFQLFTPNSSNIATISGVSFAPTIRPVGQLVAPGTPVVNQLRGATLINSASLVNTANLSGARFITTGVAGQTPVVVSAAPKPGNITVGGSNVSGNITLVPTVLNASGGQTIIPASGATIVNAAGGTRAVLNTNRLASPITLQSLGSLPYTFNLVKTSTGLSVRPQQILQSPSLAQVAGQPGYVLITPRARVPTPATPAATGQSVHTPISLVQTVPSQNLQTARVHVLAQVPSGATVLQQPQTQKNVNGVAGHSPAKKDST